MAGAIDEVPGFTVPLHRALSEPILLGGAPRAIAILNGTLAGAVGLGLRLWLVGLLIWVIGHAAAVWAAKPETPYQRAAQVWDDRIGSARVQAKNWRLMAFGSPEQASAGRKENQIIVLDDPTDIWRRLSTTLAE